MEDLKFKIVNEMCCDAYNKPLENMKFKVVTNNLNEPTMGFFERNYIEVQREGEERKRADENRKMLDALSNKIDEITKMLKALSNNNENGFRKLSISSSLREIESFDNAINLSIHICKDSSNDITGKGPLLAVPNNEAMNLDKRFTNLILGETQKEPTTFAVVGTPFGEPFITPHGEPIITPRGEPIITQQRYTPPPQPPQQRQGMNSESTAWYRMGQSYMPQSPRPGSRGRFPVLKQIQAQP